MPKLGRLIRSTASGMPQDSRKLVLLDLSALASLSYRHILFGVSTIPTDLVATSLLVPDEGTIRWTSRLLPSYESVRLLRAEVDA